MKRCVILSIVNTEKKNNEMKEKKNKRDRGRKRKKINRIS